MASSPKAVLCRYHYDPLDRVAATSALGQPEALRFYQQNRLTTEVHGAVRRTIVQHEDLLLAQQQRIDSAIETTVLTTDQQRSVLHLLDNTKADSLAYTPYGHHSADSGLVSLLGFNGEHRDPVTGHYLLGNGYRAFNPVLMRFNSPDSLSPFDEGGINAYAYCAGDPVNLVDPTGHSLFSVMAQVLRAISKFKAGARRARFRAIGPDDIDGALKYLSFDIQSDIPYKVSRLAATSAGSSGGGLLSPVGGTAKSSIAPAAARILTNRRRHFLETTFSNDPVSANRTYRAMQRYKSDALMLKEHYEKIYGPHSSPAVRYSKEFLDAQTAMDRYYREYQNRIRTFTDYLYDIRSPH
jgi:RHS repeat-associated protein